MSEPDKTTRSQDNLSSPALANDIKEAAQKELAEGQPDELAIAAEKSSLEVGQLRIKVEQLQNELDESKDLHQIRKTYVDRMFALIVGWLVTVIVFVAFSGFHKNNFSLSDSVLIAFITSTTVSVLGLFVIAAKWLFAPPHKDEAEQKKEKKQQSPAS